MKTTVSLKDFVDEMDTLSDELSAFINRQTGELVTLTSEELSAAEDDDDIDEYPEWQQEMIIKAKDVISSDDYLSLPDKFDINEYHIIEEFCYSIEDNEIRRDLLARIKGRGAFRNFKDAILCMVLKRNGIVFVKRNLRRLQLTGSKRIKSRMCRVRVEAARHNLAGAFQAPLIASIIFFTVINLGVSI